MREVIDSFVDATGCIRAYVITDFNLDQINPGRSLFALARETGDARHDMRDPRAARAVDLAAAHVRGRLLA